MQIFDELEIESNRVDPVREPRPILSTIDTYDQHTQIDYPFHAPVRGRRPGWNIPSIAVSNESINTIRTSTNVRFVSPSIPTPAGMFPNPTLPVSAPFEFLPIPNMTQSLFVDSSVQVTFFVSLSTASANALVELVVFRDNQQISQIFSVTTSAANSPTSATGSYTDTHASIKKRHVYQLRWKPTTATTITADFTNRTFQCLNLRAI
jgi:hypothetical protein